jgi:hypothetical protein
LVNKWVDVLKVPAILPTVAPVIWVLYKMSCCDDPGNDNDALVVYPIDAAFIPDVTPVPPDKIGIAVLEVRDCTATLPVVVILVKFPVLGVIPPIAPGFPNVAPDKVLAFKFGMLVVLDTIKGAVPVATVLLSDPVTDKLVPIAAPILGVTKVGVFDNTKLPEPVLVVTPEPPYITANGVVKVTLVNAPVLAVVPPIAPGFPNVAPDKVLAFKFGMLVVLDTIKGAVPVVTELIICPPKIELPELTFNENLFVITSLLPVTGAPAMNSVLAFVVVTLVFVADKLGTPM